VSFLPARDRAYLAEKAIAYDEVEPGGQRAVIFRQRSLPEGRFDTALADILILLPPGYPDLPPDMFYALPWLRLAANSNYPRCADVPFPFAGQTWQRWSRHSSEWRPGIDGIWTMLKRIETALQRTA
jgi:hypothetical protein